MLYVGLSVFILRLHMCQLYGLQNAVQACKGMNGHVSE